MQLAVRLWGRWTGKGPKFIEGSYNLKSGVWLNILGPLYLVFVCITFNFPSTYLINASNMNYTCAAVGVRVLIVAVTRFTTGSKQFSGLQAGSMLQRNAIHARHVSDSLDGSLETHNMDHKVMILLLTTKLTPSEQQRNLKDTSGTSDDAYLGMGTCYILICFCFDFGFDFERGGVYMSVYKDKRSCRP
jgi:hypothetical protein